MLRLHDNEPTRTPEADARALECRADAIFAGQHGRPFRVDDGRDVIFLVGDEPARVVPAEWVDVAATALAGPAFALELARVQRPPGFVLVVIVIDDTWITVRLLGLRAMQRGGAA